jgi:hypothetical protein
MGWQSGMVRQPRRLITLRLLRIANQAGGRKLIATFARLAHWTRGR